MRFDWRLPLLCLGSLACADFHRGPSPVDGGQDVAFDGVLEVAPDNALVADLTFEIDVYPILLLRCEGCHSAGRQGAYTGLVLAGNARLDRAMVAALVVPGDPEASLLLRRATGESHTGRDVISPESDDYATIASWIMGMPLEARPRTAKTE